tara:strand:- start:242 stop:478 length:237 start_codon:yes stop_codon:yes gene_type:complete
MKASNIPVVSALAQLREYCAKSQADVEELEQELFELKSTKRLNADERREKNEYNGSATAYCDVVRIIESKIIEVVNEE